MNQSIEALEAIFINFYLYIYSKFLFFLNFQSKNRKNYTKVNIFSNLKGETVLKYYETHLFLNYIDKKSRIVQAVTRLENNS